jgi:hypothetical protein
MDDFDPRDYDNHNSVRCEVCGCEAVGYSTDGLSRWTAPYCEECTLHRAVPVRDFEMALTWDEPKVIDHVRSLTTYVDGRYLSWEEWQTTFRGGEP